jgi:long-chain fatty acid transport protein
MLRRFLSLSLVFTSMAAVGSGFETPPQGARILGLGGATTAYVGSIAGFGSNPGLLGQWADSLTRVSFGGVGQVRRSSFIGQDTYRRTDQDLAIQPGGYFYATHGLNKRVAVGLSVSTPYGYHTKWPNAWEGRSVVQESRLDTYFVQPTFGYRLNDNFSAGVGLVYAFGRMQQRRALGQFEEANAQSTFNGTGSGFGASVGLYGRTGDNLAFGISYRTGVKLNIKNGTLNYANVPASAAAQYPTSAGFASKLNLPNVLSVGLADRITPKLLLTLDFSLSGWSALDSLNLEVEANGSNPASRIRTGRRYEDAMAFRIGAEYKLTPRFTVLGGARYDETPVRDEFINPEFPDANRLGATGGLSYQFSSRLAVEAAYGFAYGQLRTGRANQTQAQVSNVSGTYRTASHSASLGVALEF